MPLAIVPLVTDHVHVAWVDDDAEYEPEARVKVPRPGTVIEFHPELAGVADAVIAN